MVYNPPPDGVNDVRIATGNILPEDYPDEEIAKKINSAYSKIQLAVRKTLTEPFVNTDVAYGHCVQLEVSLAAMYCLKAYGPEFQDKIVELRTETDNDIAMMQEALGITIEEPIPEDESGDPNIMSTPVKGWYKNSDVMIPNRMKPYHEPGDIEGSGVPRLDPDSCCS